MATALTQDLLLEMATANLWEEEEEEEKGVTQ